MKSFTFKHISKLIIALLLFLAATITTKAEERNLGDFTKIKVSGIAQVELNQAEKCGVEIVGKDSDTSSIITTVSDGVLTIATKSKGKNADKLKVVVGIKSLEDLELSGASDVKTKNPIRVDKLNLVLSGAGDATLQLNANQIKALISGAGNLHLAGNSKLLAAKVSGAGDLKSYDLVSDSVIVKISGSGSAKVNSTKAIDAEVSGAGNVIYKGEPVERNVNISGAGSVRQAKGENEVEINESLKINHGDGDTTRLKLGDRRIMIFGDEDNKDKAEKKDEVKSIWAGFEIGVNGYLTPGGSSDFPKKYNFLELNYKKSICLNLNVWEQNFKLYKNYIALTTGAGFEFNRYYFDNNITLQPINDTVIGYDSGIDFSKNCLKASYINVPLLLEFNTHSNPKKSFHLAAGIIGGYNLSTKVKQVYELSNKTYKNKVKNDYNMNPFKLAATVRAGYGKVNFFATYGLMPFFQEKAVAPELTAFTVGVTLIHFD